MKVTVTDFQSLGSVEIEASGLTVLVGRSNLGKSALIRAVESALFNRSGDGFIRKGRTQTKVTLTDLPRAGGGAPLQVVWSKGHNLNQFTVDGVLYNKVGQDAPPVIAAAGYRRVFIGDKERGKGEEIVPQMAGQFDPLFLLTKPGSFVNDVLSVVSRLGVLLNASGRCARDLKGTKATLTTRQADLTRAEAHVAAFAPAVALHARVAALQTSLDEARAAQALLDKVKGLLTARPALAALCARPLPEPTRLPVDANWLTTLAQGQRLAAPRPRLVALTMAALPESPPREIPEVTGLVTGSALWRRRGVALLASRMDLPEDPQLGTKLTQAEAAQRMYGEVATLRAGQDRATTAVYHALQALNGGNAAQVEAEAALATALAEMTVCPVCGREMLQTAAATV